MTERDLGSYKFFVAEVVNTKDSPDKDGRVRVRMYGRHDDKTNIKDEDLPWALPIQPINSAAIGGVGTSPLGMLNGSRIYGSFLDIDQQYPIILGTFGKAGDLKGDNTTAGGTETIDTKTGSMPPAARGDDFMAAKELNAYTSRYKERKTITDTQEGKSIANTDVSSTGIKVREDIKKDMKEADTPTTASADKEDDSDILDVIKKVDPESIGASLRNAVNSFMNIRNIVNLTSAIGLTNMFSGSLSSGLSSVANVIGLDALLTILLNLLRSGLVTGIAYDALNKAIAEILNSATKNNGKPNINYVNTYIPQIDITKPIPEPLVTAVEETYIQQYYTIENEPYPGYIEWKDSFTDTKVYTLRGLEPHYASAMDHIIGDNALEIQTALLSYLLNTTEPSIEEIAAIINNLLNVLPSQANKKILGNGIDLGNIMSLAQKLVPQIASPINAIVNQHFPDSFLNVGSMTKTLSEFTQNQALLAKKKKEMEAALEEDEDGNTDQALKDYIKESVAADAAGKPPGTVVTKSTTLSDGSSYSYSVTVK